MALESKAAAASTTADEAGWTSVIRPVSGWFDLDLRQLWRYRDLVFLFVQRDFVTYYKQTILGPLWYFAQPVLTTLMFTLVFGRIAGMPTDGLPPSLFYLAGVTLWGFFANCLSRTSVVFVANASLFGKVWFPRLAVPISLVISSLITFAIQFAVLIGYLLWFAAWGIPLAIGPNLIAVPFLVLQVALLALGCGIIVSALTTKYRDLSHLIGFGVQLWMFATPVVYPASRIPERWQWVIAVNPMAPVIEAFRAAMLGVGTVRPAQMTASVVATLLLLVCGVVLFSRIEKSFMDVV